MVDILSYSYYQLLMGNGRNLKEKKVRKNLIQIQIQVQKVNGQCQEHLQVGINQLECRNITSYDPVALMKIKHVTNTDNRYK